MEKVLVVSYSREDLINLRDTFENSGYACKYLVLSNNLLVDTGAFIPSCIVIRLKNVERRRLFAVMQLRADVRFRKVPILLIADVEQSLIFNMNVRPAADQLTTPDTEMPKVLEMVEGLIEKVGRKKHVLAVDDDLVSLKRIQLFLESKYQVSCLKTGEECLRFLEKRIPDVLLLDCDMPVMDGAATFKGIQDMGLKGAFPVIMMSLNSERRIVYRGLAMIPDGFMLKPLNKDKLEEKIEELT